MSLAGSTGKSSIRKVRLTLMQKKILVQLNNKPCTLYEIMENCSMGTASSDLLVRTSLARLCSQQLCSMSNPILGTIRYHITIDGKKTLQTHLAQEAGQ